METKTLLSILLCYHVATKNQPVYRFDKNYQSSNGLNIVASLCKCFDQTLELLKNQTTHLSFFFLHFLLARHRFFNLNIQQKNSLKLKCSQLSKVIFRNILQGFPTKCSRQDDTEQIRHRCSIICSQNTSSIKRRIKEREDNNC